jgi:integrase
VLIPRKAANGAVKYAVRIKVGGEQHWVGTYATRKEAKQAELEALLKRSRVSGRAPTVREFAGAVIHEDGKITMRWPDGEPTQKATGRRDSSTRRLREGLRPFVREFADTRMNKITRDEAMTWALPRGANTQQAVRQFFNHALARKLVEENPFTHLGASKRKRRIERPDFQIITNEQYERLLQAARHSRADEYGPIIEGALLAVGEVAMRPGEAFALHPDDVDFQENVIHVRRQLDMDTLKLSWPKDDTARSVVMTPRLRRHLETMPRISPSILLPAPRGGYMSRSNWSKHWHSVRASAGMPGQEFYELKHRAIQWMVDPIEDGGLGLDPPTAAELVGHDDGGYLIATVYTKLGEKRALARAQRAMEALSQSDKKQAQHLRVVGEE